MKECVMPSPEQVSGIDIKTFIGLVTVVVGALASAIVYVAKKWMAKEEDTKTRLDECEKDRKELFVKVASQGELLGELKGKVEVLSGAVLDRVHNKKTDEE